MTKFAWTWTLSVAILLSASVSLLAAADGHKGECDRYSIPNS